MFAGKIYSNCGPSRSISGSHRVLPHTVTVMNYYERLTRKPGIHLTPQIFLQEVIEYFKWCENHPLLEEKIFQYKGAIVKANEGRMRAFTKKGLATYLGMTEARLAGYKKRGEEWAEALEMVDQAIYTQKFEGAAAGLLNATMITRDLGLAEKTEIAGAEGAPPVAFTLTPMKSGTFLPPETAGLETPT